MSVRKRVYLKHLPVSRFISTIYQYIKKFLFIAWSCKKTESNIILIVAVNKAEWFWLKKKTEQNKAKKNTKKHVHWQICKRRYMLYLYFYLFYFTEMRLLMFKNWHRKVMKNDSSVCIKELTFLIRRSSCWKKMPTL